jgi:hypothetical protein
VDNAARNPCQTTATLTTAGVNTPLVEYVDVIGGGVPHEPGQLASAEVGAFAGGTTDHAFMLPPSPARHGPGANNGGASVVTGYVHKLFVFESRRVNCRFVGGTRAANC